VSMSDVAASGGYYISCGASKIFALDDTLTGSIGVVGGKIALAGGLAKLGIETYPMGKGKHATMWSSLGPWTQEERDLVTKLMEDTYGVFKSRVAEGRHKTVDEVEQIAKGRVWTGAKAKQLGLVDDIGGLDAALDAARSVAKIDASVEIEVYPSSITLRDVLHSFGQVETPLGLADELAAIAAVDPALAEHARGLLELIASFRTTTVQTVAVLPVLK
jgi:protease-4